jgi:hypothetical protein
MEKQEHESEPSTKQKKEFQSFVGLAKKLFAVPREEVEKQKTAEAKKQKKPRRWGRKAMF